VIHGLDLEDVSRPPVARLNSSGLPIHAGQNNKVWRGLVQVEACMEPALPVVLKWMGAAVHKLPLELACSLAAAELGLPVPRGLLVIANRDQLVGLPQYAKPIPGTDDVLCFGSMHQWPDDTGARQLNNAAAEEYTWRQLCDDASAAPGAAWDELTANADRHAGNLLFDGRKYWFIDHDLALQPIAKAMRDFVAQKTRLDLIEHRARANVVADELVRRHPRDHGIMAQPTRFSRAENRLRMLADKVRAWNYGVAAVDDVWPLTEIVLRGIALRLPALALMLSQRLSLPDRQLLWNSSSPPQ